MLKIGYVPASQISAKAQKVATKHHLIDDGIVIIPWRFIGHPKSANVLLDKHGNRYKVAKAKRKL